MEFNKLKSFKNLLVWQKSSDLAVLVYSNTNKFPQSELYGITNQMRRAVVSISSNIAEGFKRVHNREKIQFYNIAGASVSELESQIEISYRLNFIDYKNYAILCENITEISKMINGLIKSTTNHGVNISRSILVVLFLISISYILNPVKVFASEFSFTTQDTSFKVGDSIKVDLNINTNREQINALEGRVIFSEENLELVEIRNANSIVNFWIDKPAYKDNGIIFSGITPGGYMLDSGFVMSFIFKIKKEGEAFVKIQNVSALKNDGNGTKATTKTKDFRFNILGVSSNNNELLKIIDKDSPDTFSPEISKDINLLDNKNFVVFVAQDKGSGIDKYEIKESRYKFFNFSKWKIAESPYVLEDQNLSSYVYIKAQDKQGNVRIVKLSPKNPLKWYENIEDWFIIVLVMSVALTFYVRKYKK